jgi:hypothetical protein
MYHEKYLCVLMLKKPTHFSRLSFNKDCLSLKIFLVEGKAGDGLSLRKFYRQELGILILGFTQIEYHEPFITIAEH